MMQIKKTMWVRPSAVVIAHVFEGRLRLTIAGTYARDEFDGSTECMEVEPDYEQAVRSELGIAE